MIANLRHLHDRRGLPAGKRVRSDEPVDRTLGGPGGDERAHDKPAVVVLPPPVDEFERAAGRVLDQEALRLRLGSDDQTVTGGQRRDLIGSGGVAGARAVGLAGENAAVGVSLIRSAKEKAGEELEVEADLADEGGGHGLFEIDEDAETRAFGPHADGVGELQVGVVDRIESAAVPRFVGILHPDADLLGRPIDLPLPGFGNGLPLAGRAIQPEVAVGRHAQAVLNDADAALMALRIVVVREHHVEPGHLEVFEFVEGECGRSGRRVGGGQASECEKRGEGGGDEVQRAELLGGQHGA